MAPKRKGKGWHESGKPTPTKTGIRNIAPDHYAVSRKKELETTLRRPLVMVDDDSGVKIVEKAIEARNPIEQFQNQRLIYQGEYTIIRETLQNSERIARDRKVPVDVVMTFTPDSFTIEDNAGGVTKRTIDVVFKLGTSGYEQLGSETTPFGQGFISFVKIFGKAEIISNSVNAEFDWDWIEAQYKLDKNFNMAKAYKVAEYPDDTQLKAKGKFIAKFTKPVSSYDMNKAIKIAKEISRTMQVNSITINGERLNNRIDFKTPPNNFIKAEKKYGEKDGIEGWFYAGTERDYLRLYDNGAPVGSVSSEIVDNRYTDLSGLVGVVNIKHTYYGQANNARDAWINDDRIQRTVKFINGLAKDLAINFVKYGTDSQIEKYQHFISNYTTFDEIKYHIHFEVIEPEVLQLVNKVERAIHKEMTEEAFKSHIAGIMKSPSQLTAAVERAKDYNPQLDQTAYNEKQKMLLEERSQLQIERQSQESPREQQETIQRQEGTSHEVEPESGGEVGGTEDKQEVIEDKLNELEQQKTTQDEKRKTLNEKIDEFLNSRKQGGMTFAEWKKETFWCDRKEVEEFTDSIKMAGYYHINVAIAENKFQREGFQTFENFHHISELESSMNIVPTLALPGARNAQERRIEWIMRVFLDAAGFTEFKLIIANITARRVLTLGKGTRKKVDEPISLEAYAEFQTNTVYLQRTLAFGEADGVRDYSGIKALYPYLSYNEFPNDSKSIGQGDIAVFSKIRKTLAHELAHLKYKTKDDTTDHFRSMVIIDTAFDKAIAEFKASSRLTEDLTGLNKKAKERLGIQKGDTVVVTVTKGAAGELEKQAVPDVRKTTLKDIYVQPATENIFTYRELIDRYTLIEDLQKVIAEGTYKFTGYKIGDRVQILSDGDEIIATIKTTDQNKNVAVEVEGSVAPPYYYFRPSKIVKLLERKVMKYKMGDIFVREDGYFRTYKDIQLYYESGDFPIESGKYRPTGLKIGSTISIGEGEDRTGKITKVKYGQLVLTAGTTGMEIWRDWTDLNRPMPEPVGKEEKKPEASHEPEPEPEEVVMEAPKKEETKKQMSIDDLL